MAKSLLLALREVYPGPIDWAVGADTSSTKLMEDVAEIAGIWHAVMVKVEDDQGKRQVWSPANLDRIVAGEVVFHGEELVTTAHSALQVREGVRLGNPDLEEITYAPFVATIVDRSDPRESVATIGESRLISLARYEICNYTPEECQAEHYCAVGSEAIPPKKDNNWARLTGRAA